MPFEGEGRGVSGVGMACGWRGRAWKLGGWGKMGAFCSSSFLWSGGKKMQDFVCRRKGLDFERKDGIL